MRILGFDNEGNDKALTASEARTASQTFTHTFTEEPPEEPGNFDRWTEIASGITYTWYSNTWVEFGPGGNFIDAVFLPTNITAPVATFATFVGETATVTNGTWENSPYMFQYTWQIDVDGWVDVVDADESEFIVPEEGEFRAGVRARNGAGWSEWSYSESFEAVAPPTGMTFDGVTSSAAVLSNSGTTLTNGGGQEFATAWLASPKTGKIYMEVILNRGASNNEHFIVFSGDGITPTDGGSPVIHWDTPRGGASLLGWSSFFRANYGMSTGATTGSITSYGSPRTQERFKIAADMTTRQFWIKEVGSAFAGDPAAGTTPLFTLNGTAGIIIGAAVVGTASVTLINPSEHLDTPPTGFTAI